MPIFDMKCECGLEIFDVIINHNCDHECPVCGKVMVKQISRPAPPQFVGGKPFSHSAKVRRKDKD